MNQATQTQKRGLLRGASRVNEAYGFVFLLTLLSIITLSISPDKRWDRLFDLTLVVFTAMAGILASNVNARRLRTAFSAAATAITLSFISVFAESDALEFLAITIAAALLLACVATILKRIVNTTSVNFRTILGALTSYTMIGLLFAYTYLATSLMQDEPFFQATDKVAPGDLLFFSYTTLTTTGYGNLVPAGEPGQTISIFEMLTGQIFLVVLVAGLVSLWRPERTGKQH
ncbi:MAG: hypothetical protein JHC87_04565 [Thermoleophilaceae bacterium]|nr:hypothetical protein [Thermoleophilaceae bacterium]